VRLSPEPVDNEFGDISTHTREDGALEQRTQDMEVLSITPPDSTSSTPRNEVTRPLTRTPRSMLLPPLAHSYWAAFSFANLDPRRCL
jgi:hypothetical protein